MLIGIRCRCTNCDNHFCRHTPTEGEYQGDKYVYTAHADPPFDDEILKSVNKLSGNFTFCKNNIHNIDLNLK